MSRDMTAFHAARWAEPLITQLSMPGERGVLLAEPDPAIRQALPDPVARIPETLRRAEPPALPEVSQARVLRHYTRLSQMTMGVDVTPDMMGTCTMKYSPKVHEALAGLPQLAEQHPEQDPAKSYAPLSPVTGSMVFGSQLA